MTDKRIEDARATKQGFFLPSRGETCFRTMDGPDVAEWLAASGYVVTGYRDTGRNGLATTECGVRVSTNGYVSFN